jgi:hypothetical protein
MINKLIGGGMFYDVENALTALIITLLPNLKFNGMVWIMHFMNHIWKIYIEEQRCIMR